MDFLPTSCDGPLSLLGAVGGCPPSEIFHQSFFGAYPNLQNLESHGHTDQQHNWWCIRNLKSGFMDFHSKNYGDSKPPKKRSTIYSKPFKRPVVTFKKKHPGDTIPSPGNSNTLGIFFSLFENGLLTIPQDSNQKLHRAESRTIKMP